MPSSLLARFALACLLGSGPTLAAVRGVPPERHAQYEYTQQGFRCVDGSRTVPTSAVNDDYCDCSDGSDEPGTGACAGLDKTLFHCANDGSTPQLIYASRVDDGVCDCCDGSDEAGLNARWPSRQCTNRCEEDGRRERQERTSRMEKLKDGLKSKRQLVAQASAERQSWRDRIERLKAELPGLEAAVEEETKKSEAAEKAAAEAPATPAGLEAELAALREKVKAQEAQLERLQQDLEACRAASVGAPATTDGGREAKPVVSEYAKWMEGAGSTPGAIEDHLAAGVDLGDEELAGDGEDSVPSPTEPSADEATAKSSAVAEAEGKVQKHKDEIQRLEKKLQQLSEDRLGFSSLLDHCLSKTDNQYTYKLCFFNDAKQDHTLLGKWKGWTGPREAHFADGHMCPGGPARDLKIVFECAGEEAVLDVSEPSRCSYSAHVAHPGACDDADEAALLRPPVRHPKDEL